MIRHNTAGLSREEWLKLRTSIIGVGGSDTGTILGLNPWQGPAELFHKKIGNVNMQDFMEQSAFHGIYLEDYVADLFRFWDGSVESMMQNKQANTVINKVSKVNAILINEKYPWLFANLDRKFRSVDGKEKGVLECKTLSGYVSEMWDGGVPPAHLAQVTQYMMVTGDKMAYIATLKDGRDFYSYPIEFDKNFAQQIEQETYDFISRVNQGLEIMSNVRNSVEREQMLTEIQPTDENAIRYDAFLSEKFKQKRGEVTMEAGLDDVKAITEYLAQKELESTHAGLKSAAISSVKEKMINNGAKTMIAPGFGKVTWAGNGFRVTISKS